MKMYEKVYEKVHEMKKTTYRLFVITIVLGMLLAGCGVLAGCGSQESNEGSAGGTESSTQASTQADTQPVTIDHRYASKEEGDRFFDSAAAALVPIDGTDTYYLPEDASNFDEILGKNTDYVVDPEECMADNFGFLIAYDKDCPEGKGYPNPEIIEGIRSYLQQK